VSAARWSSAAQESQPFVVPPGACVHPAEGRADEREEKRDLGHMADDQGVDARLRGRADLLQVVKRLVPDLASEGVVGEAVDVLGQTIAVDALDRLDDPGVERAAAILKQAPVGDLVRQRVLERVLEIGEQLRLVDELGGLQARETAPEVVFDAEAIARGARALLE
jgi:hypothetical protein